MDKTPQYWNKLLDIAAAVYSDYLYEIAGKLTDKFCRACIEQGIELDDDTRQEFKRQFYSRFLKGDQP